TQSACRRPTDKANLCNEFGAGSNGRSTTHAFPRRLERVIVLWSRPNDDLLAVRFHQQPALTRQQRCQRPRVIRIEGTGVMPLSHRASFEPESGCRVVTVELGGHLFEGIFAED